MSSLIHYDLHDFDPDYRRLIPQIINAFFSAFPMARLREVGGYRKSNDRSLGYTTNGRISLNLHWYAQPCAALEDAAVKGARRGLPNLPLWHDGMREPEHTLVHEFAHALADGLRDNAHFRKMRNCCFEAARRYPEEAVSGYALTNEEEWWPETFAAVHIGDRVTRAKRQTIEVAAFLRTLSDARGSASSARRADQHVRFHGGA